MTLDQNIGPLDSTEKPEPLGVHLLDTESSTGAFGRWSEVCLLPNTAVDRLGNPQIPAQVATVALRSRSASSDR